MAVLLPIYKNDSLEYFKLSLNSVFSQTFHNYKIFVGVDGEVPYATKTYLQEMDKRGDVEVCWFPKNRGLACVLNDLIAIAHVQGFDYLARMDADDVMLSSRLQNKCLIWSLIKILMLWEVLLKKWINNLFLVEKR